MIYETRDDILRAYLTWREAQPGPVKGDEPELVRFGYLLNVYHQACLEPPDGVIGVGIITYAQQKLVEAQQ